MRATTALELASLARERGAWMIPFEHFVSGYLPRARTNATGRRCRATRAASATIHAPKDQLKVRYSRNRSIPALRSDLTATLTPVGVASGSTPCAFCRDRSRGMRAHHRAAPLVVVRIEAESGRVGLRLIGELDLNTVELLDAELAHTHEHSHPSVIDISELRFLDLTGLRALQRVGQRDAAPITRLLGATGIVRRLIEVAQTLDADGTHTTRRRSRANPRPASAPSITTTSSMKPPTSPPLMARRIARASHSRHSRAGTKSAPPAVPVYA
jgi:anti-anti-sigma factor